MCGVIGVYNGDALGIKRDQFERARDLMVHRGPDDSGYFADETVYLGHRRLSIIDIDGGHQPMQSEDGSVYIVFNGEIYNFRELRDDLQARGFSFQTRSDTEVILNLYLEQGLDSIKMLNGIFAIAIWDRRTRELHLARDHIGVKPLYYMQKGNCLAFASEVKSVLDAFQEKPEIESDAVEEYLVFREVASEQTLFRGVKRLLPGHTMTISGSGTTLDCYWRMSSENSGRFSGSFDDAVDQLDDLLRNSIEAQMISDVPLGTFCSGGVDSSLVTAIASEFSRSRMHTFSVGFSEADFDESAFAELVSNKYGTEHHQIQVSNEEFAEQLPRMIWHNDEPLHFPNSVQIHAISRIAREFVTVVLTGEGADELFAGYPRYQIPGLLRVWRSLPGLVRNSIAWSARSLGDHRADLLQAFQSLPNDADLILNSATSAVIGNTMQPETVDRLIKRRRNLLLDSSGNKDLISRLSLLEQKTYLQSILNRQDKMSMAASIESRVPFLDWRILEFANELPAGYKIARMENKRVLKAVAERYLPREIVYRRKSGFGVPLAQWFRSSDGMGKLLSKLTDDEFIAAVFGEQMISRICSEHQTGVADHSDTLWTAVNLQLWRSTFDLSDQLKRAA